MFKRFIPHNEDFFDFFDAHARYMVEIATTFQEIVSKESLDVPVPGVIKNIEHQADMVTRLCIQALHNTFITPIDREDIFRLIKQMDDVVDAIDEAFDRIEIYKLKTMNDYVRRFADVNVRATRAIQAAVNGLRTTSPEIVGHCQLVFDLEHEGDLILKTTLEELFEKEPDIRMVMKWKEVYENLEDATDCCNHVVDTIQGILIEQA